MDFILRNIGLVLRTESKEILKFFSSENSFEIFL